MIFNNKDLYSIKKVTTSDINHAVIYFYYFECPFLFCWNPNQVRSAILSGITFKYFYISVIAFNFIYEQKIC